jgi:thiol-disulfide isomerase/thioredoxin
MKRSALTKARLSLYIQNSSGHCCITTSAMRLSTLKELPWPLFITSFALTSFALPARSTSLTSENFKSTISKGVWFIQHFSPYCSHCQSFAPTWKKLVEANEKAVEPGIRLAEVNCAVNGGRPNSTDNELFVCLTSGIWIYRLVYHKWC